MIEKDVPGEHYCDVCDETHREWHREHYQHNPSLKDLYVCEQCMCGTEPHEFH